MVKTIELKSWPLHGVLKQVRSICSEEVIIVKSFIGKGRPAGHLLNFKGRIGSSQLRIKLSSLRYRVGCRPRLTLLEPDRFQ